MTLMADDRCDLLCLDLEKAEELRKNRLSPTAAEQAAAQAKALGDPTRLAIAHALIGGEELCVCDLSWVMERPENLVSHHLRSLRQADIVRSRREGKMVLYSLTERGNDLLAATLGRGAATR
jgi:DNA-binding transcriptional ArsR family regulator